MDLAIVIVNYRTADLTIECLHSLATELAHVSAARVYIADNASDDDSVERITQVIEMQGWRDWVELLPLRANGGFAAGNNAAIRAALSVQPSPRYILLLNPDTIVRPGAVQQLRQFMENNPLVGIVGSRLEDPDGTPQRSAFHFPTVWSELDFGLRLGIVSKLLSKWISAPPVRDDAHEIEWVAGASMMIRREVFDRVGLLDEGYFMYYEEVDFCLQAKRAGWRCWYVPMSRVVHLVGQASGVTNTRKAPSRRPPYWFESRRRFFIKNRGLLGAVAADIAFSVGYATWRVRRHIQGKPDLDPPCMLGDLLRHSALFRGGRL